MVQTPEIPGTGFAPKCYQFPTLNGLHKAWLVVPLIYGRFLFNGEMCN